jgi:GWxTD domain-containing protein
MKMMLKTMRLRRRIVGWVAVVLMALTGADAQPIFTLDAAGYRQQSGLIYLEVYLMIQRNALQFNPAGEDYQALARISLDLYSPDTLLSTTSWEIVDKVQDPAELSPRQKLPDIAAFNLPPGKFRLQGKVEDLNRDTTYTKALDLDLSAYSDTVLQISNLEFATQIERTEEVNKFYKNGFRVIPNPERLYGTALPMLYFYSEIYNFEDSTGEFTVDRIVLDSARKEVKRLPVKVHKKVGSSAVEVDGFSIASLPSGTYYLKVVVVDGDNGETTSAESKFFIFRPGDFSPERIAARSEADQSDSEILSYNDAQLSDAIEEIKYLLSDSEWRSIGALNKDGQKQFLIRFWRERDSNPATPVNEFKDVFISRKQYCNEKFGVLDKEGWKTDRGRVYILYGKPDDIEYHTHDLDTRPYEIWHYDSLEGGVIFAFVDRNGYGDYRLVHSTKNGEIYRPDWFDQEASIRRK